MLQKKQLVIMLIMCITIVAKSQNKTIFSLENTLFKNFYSFHPSKINVNSANDMFITGDFTAYDTNNIPHSPYFIKKLDSILNDDYTYIEEGSGFVIFNFKNNALCFDEQNNLYTAGTVNDNKTICKTGLNGNIIWSKRQGHHSFTDMFYHNGKLILTGQDENSNGNHTILISIIDTSGVLLKSKNFYTQNTFNNASKVIKLNNGYLLVGSAFNNNNKGLFIIKVDFNLNKQWAKTYFENNKYHTIKGAKFDLNNKEIIISGYSSSTQQLDSSFVLKLSENGNLIYYKYYFTLDSLILKNTSTEIDKDGNIFLGCTKLNPYTTNPVVVKTQSNGDVQWARNYATNNNTIEAISDIKIINDDKLQIIGNYFDPDSSNSLYKSIFTLKVDLDSGIWPCDTVIKVNSISKNIQFYSNINEEDYIGALLDYQFISNQNQFNIINEYNCDDTVKALNNLNLKSHKISFSNPSSNEIHLFYNSNYYKNLHFEIYNIQGRMILQTKINPSYIDTRRIEDGIYFLAFYDKKNHIKTQKVIIIK